MQQTPQTESRKKDHVELVLEKGAQYGKSAGFEHVELVHNALPEMSLDEVDLSTTFFGKKVTYPLLITAMTGGYGDAKKINQGLAEAAQEHGLALGLGSQRAMIENPSLADTYKVRDVAPDIPLLANIGACQLKDYPLDKVGSMISAVEADGLAIHLNPLQEVIQGEGDTDFRGVLDAIRNACEHLDVPVMVKETGAGMSQEIALKLKQAGADYLDIAGAGGTSWSRVEYLRSETVPGFEDWGLPTVESIMECRDVLPLVASGGIRSGIDCAKAIALGSDMCGAAYPFLKALQRGSLSESIGLFKKQMRICSFLTGSRNIEELQKAHLFIH